MRRLLASTPVVVAAALALLGVITWAILSNARHRRVVIHDRPVVTTPIVSTPLTPLQARRAKRTMAAKSPDSTTAVGSTGTRTNSTGVSVGKTPTRSRSPTPTKRKTTRTRPKATTQPASSPSAQTQPTPPAPEPQPAVTVPLPAICTEPIHIGTCP